MSAPPVAPATYGDLMLRAAMGIQAGVSWVQNFPLEEPQHARRAVNDFWGLLRALKEHTWVLLDLRRVGGIVASPAPDPRERAAVRLAEVLHELVGTSQPWASFGGPASPTPWMVASRCIATAGELMATHADAGAAPRSPDLDAVLRYPAARQAGLAQVGDMAAVLLAGTEYLALRAGQAGVPWPEVRWLLPDLSEVRAYARDVVGTGTVPEWASLDELTVARPPVREGERATEFTDRMRRLRRAAWQDARSATPSVDTLKTYAMLGVAVHAHALAFRGLPPSALTPDASMPRRLAGLVVRGRAWQDVSGALLEWRTAQPGDAVVAGDFAKVIAVLRAVAPLTGDRAALSTGERRDAGRAIATASATIAEIGGWNQSTLARMGGGHQLYVGARTLTGAQVTNSPDLVEAKLAGRVTPVSPAQIESAKALYAHTWAKPDPSLLGADGLTLRAEPLRTAFATAGRSHDSIGRRTP